MDLGLEGKVALVAASSKGLGRAVATELAHEGAKLMICARGRGPLEAARAKLEASGAHVCSLAVDLTDPAGVAAVVEAAQSKLGPIDILVTNTGGPPAGPFESHTPQAWSQAVDQILGSVVNLTRATLPSMKERGWGRIVNVTSIAVKQPVDGLILSNSVRAAVTGFARTLANEVATFGITVNNVLPGYTRTDRLQQLAQKIGADTGQTPYEAMAQWERQIPMNRVGEPHEFAAMVAFLCSQRAAYVTGSSIAVDGGWIRSLL